MKAKVPVTSVTVATTKFLFGMLCNCAVDVDVGTGDFLFHTCDRTCLRARAAMVKGKWHFHTLAQGKCSMFDHH